MRSLFFYFYLAVGVLSVALNTENLSGEQLKTWLQTRQSFYEAGDAFFSLEDLKARLMDKKYRLDEETPFAESKVIDEATIPASFDARTKWGSECPSVSSIRQQSGCGSCWAFSTAEVMSDRTCIHSAGKTKVTYSPEDILDCCSSYSKTCGSCDGGYPATALNYWHAKGVVTGGDYGSASGCKPYTISPTNSNPATPKCSTACRSGYSTSYANDKHFASSASYRVTAKNVAAIQTEIMNNGPVVTSFTVYEDFNHYKSGVYVHSSGKEVGGHAVKIIGWGTDNGTPYWIVANSWGASWGEKGFFRIIRGVDECGIEEYIYGATPK